MSSTSITMLLPTLLCAWILGVVGIGTFHEKISLFFKNLIFTAFFLLIPLVHLRIIANINAFSPLI